MRLIAAITVTGLLIVATEMSSTTPLAPAIAQEKCLHGTSESPEQAARRKQALSFARQVNTLQSRSMSTSKAYLPLAQLTPAPPDFEAKLAADAAGYSFSVVDQLDPCRFGFFSNESGLIFRGEVIR